MEADALDSLAGVAPGSMLDGLRRAKPITRDNAQASFAALFTPADTGAMSAVERAAVALFVALLQADPPGIAFYRDRLAATGAPPALVAATEAAGGQAAAAGPYGCFPPGPLGVEDAPGPGFTLPAGAGEALGPRLAAALAHTHMLVLHPRDAAPTHVQALQAAGWSATGIVTLSQLVAFLSFQLRAAAGLRALAAAPVAP